MLKEQIEAFSYRKARIFCVLFIVVPTCLLSL